MFTVEIRINGMLINHIYGRNMTAKVKGQDCYKYELYETETQKIRTGEVHHNPKNGIRQLIAEILNDVKDKSNGH